MARIPVITGFGGINAAGRSSGHHGYCRTVIDALGSGQADQTWQSLAALMGRQGELTDEAREYLRRHTLIRHLEAPHFNPADVSWNRRIKLKPVGDAISFILLRRDLPTQIPASWRVTELDQREVRVDVDDSIELLCNDRRVMDSSAGGQLPMGFDPQALYAARSHPRGLQLAVYGASDALGNLGIDWEVIRERVPADLISCYAGSAMSQLDGYGNGGMMASRYRGKRVTSKHVALGFAEMPADFVNAYVLGSMGGTGHTQGACATSLYNLKQGVHDIREGRARVVLVGAAEAPLLPEIYDGYGTMRALASDQELLNLDRDKGLSEPDWRRACRPFGDNCGFTLAESVQFFVLMDDELALELGADIHGSVADVFVNADGHKKSISAPGVGNFLTMARAAALARSIIGEQGLRERSFVQAHGTGTPANRRTESRILDDTAKAMGITDWPVAAVKCYVGHSIGAAGGDQLASALGVWAHGIIPAIATIESIADDVADAHLQFPLQHLERGVGALDACLINSKGFGGNNATATVLAPQVTERLMAARHGTKVLTAWRHKREQTRARSASHDAAASAGEFSSVYRFDHDVRHDEHVHITPDAVTVDGYEQPISLDIPNPFE
jgi:acetoacetyl-[acyl-carrier protein] synthase